MAVALRFPGQWFQAESGLHQNWMRDYDPTTGRYIQPDPLGLIDGPGVYGYALQSPMVWTDPTGEFVAAPWAILGGIAIGAGLDFLWQMYRNGGDIDCVNWAEVGLAGAVGAFGGAWGHAWKAGAAKWRPRGGPAQAAFRELHGLGKDYIAHHAIFSAGGQALRNVPGFQHGWWNFRGVQLEIHKGVHRYKTVPYLNPFRRWLYATPAWLLGAQGSAWLGTGAQFALGERCGCEN